MRTLKPLVAATVVAAVAIGTVGPNAQTNDSASALLEIAIQKQWVSGDLVGAMRDYQAILDRFGNDRRIAAQALWRLAQGQEQMGRPDDARRSYQRLISQYSGEPALVGAARTRLEGLADEESWNEPALSTAVVAPNVELDPTAGVAEYVANVTTNTANRPIVFSDLAVYDPGSGETRRLVTAARSAAYPVASPDGTWVAYMSWNGDLAETATRRRSGGYASPSAAELRIVRMSGAGDHVVVPQLGVRWLRPFAWSANNDSVLTLIERTSGLRQIALVDADTGDLRVLKETPWLSVQDMSLSANGRVAAYQVPAPRGARQYEFFALPVGASVLPRPEWHYALEVGEQRGTRLSADELAIHVLNRTGFGPRAGDIARVRAMGIDAYIEEQLHPERIADPVVDEKIRNFRSLRMEIPDLLEKSGPAAAIAARRRATMFEREAVLERAAAEAGTPDATLAARLRAGPRVLIAADRPYDYESQTARMIRAVHSSRQLQEVMVDFWMNHFNINLGDDKLTPSFEEQVIRANALGNFERLLSGVAHHPKMLLYLDNWISSAPSDVIEERLARARESADVDATLDILEREPFLKASKGLNENFARELLELHTMGVGSGYTQQDIIEVAKILSGWTIGSEGIVNGREDDGVFMFDPMMHVEGDKVVLGQTFRSGGVEEGEQLLRMLAHRSETARFISTKLARRFIADTPPEAVIEAASRTFLGTGGDIREVVRTILMSSQFRSSDYVGVKIKKPFELVASSLRAVNASFEHLSTYAPFLGGNQSLISRMGEKMYNHEAPDGNPDVGAAWMNSNALLLRLQFANELASNKIRGVTSDLPSAGALLTEMGIPRPTEEQLERHRDLLEAQAIPIPTMAGMKNSMMGGGAESADTEPPIDLEALAVSFMLGSPQFQKR